MPQRISLIVVLVLAVVLAVVAFMMLPSSRGQEASGGYSFTMTMASPGQDDVVFSGNVLGGDMSLRGRVGGIETVDLLTGGKLYLLTPAIRTAKELDNPDPPGRNTDDWPEWLLEPGRVNPLTFASVLGEDSDKNGQVNFGADGKVEAVFDHGKLGELHFPSPSDGGTITYTYSDFEQDASLTKADFEVPEGYR